MNTLYPTSKPLTQYAKSGATNIAYQTVGSGPIDLVYIPGWISNIDWMWQCPELVCFLQELSKLARVILFDKRGTGLSDRIVGLSTLEERMDDIRAVMDAVGSEKAVLFGHSEGGSASVLFAATYPNRVISLIGFGAFAKRRYSDNYPWAPTDEERQEVYDMIENYWGNGQMNLQALAPSKASDRGFMDWLANYFRSGASPGAAMLLTEMNTQVDIINILGSVRVPTLIMQRRDDIDVKIEEGRFLAERIEGAKLVEFEGSDHLFWVGNTEEVLREIKSFIFGIKPREKYEKQLLTILIVDRVASEDTLSQPMVTVDEVVAKYDGRMISKSDTMVVAFDGPSRAVYSGLSLMDAGRNLNFNFSIGIHIMEVETDEMDSLCGEAKIFVENFKRKITPQKILITQTVKYLLFGTGLSFIEQHLMFDNSGEEQLALFAVNDPNSPEFDQHSDLLTRKNAFIDEVLNCIKNHMEDEVSVEVLCKDIGISQRQLQRKLKTITDKSPVQFISSVKLHRAKELLLLKDMNITEVAFKAGFSSPSYFSKKFKQEFGISPSSLVDDRM